MWPMPIEFDSLWSHVISSWEAPPWHTVHGPDHWRRVERNGILLATRTGADLEVVRLFALFHDSRRENDNFDPEHGLRGGIHAEQLCGSVYEISDTQLALLKFACIHHADGLTHEDPTIGSCWDADRLDLGRVGVIPSPFYMSTAFGKEIAEFGSIYPFAQAAGLLPGQ